MNRSNFRVGDGTTRTNGTGGRRVRRTSFPSPNDRPADVGDYKSTIRARGTDVVGRVASREFAYWLWSSDGVRRGARESADDDVVALHFAAIDTAARRRRENHTVCSHVGRAPRNVNIVGTPSAFFWSRVAGDRPVGDDSTRGNNLSRDHSRKR